MMDSQEIILETGNQEEVKQEATAPEVENQQEEVEIPQDIEETPQEEEHKVYTTKKEVLDRVKEIAHGEDTPQKENCTSPNAKPN